MGGPHDASVLVQMAVDQLLQERPGRFLVQSAGNYRRPARTPAARSHPASVAITALLTVDQADPTINELEIWYDGTDELAVRIDPPTGSGPTVTLGAKADIVTAGQVVGRVYHRASDPNNGDHHIDAFLVPEGTTGTWTVTLEAARRVRERTVPRLAGARRGVPAVSGQVHRRLAGAWLHHRHAGERTGGAGGRRLRRAAAGRPVAGTSSSGTDAGRAAPSRTSAHPGSLCWRPGRPRAGASESGRRRRARPGTSMAAPHVAGAVALCLQASAGRVTAQPDPHPGARVASTRPPPPIPHWRSVTVAST